MTDEALILHPPTHLRLVAVGPLEPGFHTPGHPVTIAGVGMKGERVEVSDYHQGDCGGDAVKPDGSFQVITVPLPPGVHVFRVFTTTAQGQRGPASKPLTVHIPAGTAA